MDDGDYVLRAHDEEIARLGVQHAVWRPKALDAWRRAGLTVGQRVIDFGCGPGCASLDLADVVGRLVDLGRVDAAEADAMRRDFAAATSDPRTRMVTPMVVEIIARRIGEG
jgi:hypothetical protein